MSWQKSNNHCYFGEINNMLENMIRMRSNDDVAFAKNNKPKCVEYSENNKLFDKFIDDYNDACDILNKKYNSTHELILIPIEKIEKHKLFENTNEYIDNLVKALYHANTQRMLKINDEKIKDKCVEFVDIADENKEVFDKLFASEFNKQQLGKYFVSPQTLGDSSFIDDSTFAGVSRIITNRINTTSLIDNIALASKLIKYCDINNSYSSTIFKTLFAAICDSKLPVDQKIQYVDKLNFDTKYDEQMNVISYLMSKMTVENNYNCIPILMAVLQYLVKNKSPTEITNLLSVFPSDWEFFIYPLISGSYVSPDHEKSYDIKDVCELIKIINKYIPKNIGTADVLISTYKNDHFELFKFMIDEKICDVNGKNKFDHSILSTVVADSMNIQNERYLDYILSRENIDVNIQNLIGQTPLMILLSQQNNTTICERITCNTFKQPQMIGIDDDEPEETCEYPKCYNSCHLIERKSKLELKKQPGTISETVRKLISNKNCDVNIPDINGTYPIDLIIKSKNVKLFDMITDLPTFDANNCYDELCPSCVITKITSTLSGSEIGKDSEFNIYALRKLISLPNVLLFKFALQAKYADDICESPIAHIGRTRFTSLFKKAISNTKDIEKLKELSEVYSLCSENYRSIASRIAELKK